MPNVQMKEKTPQQNELIKRKQLQQHKTLATGLFLLMIVIYICCEWLLKNPDYTWVGYVKAFAEAAMVGALADWFAVTALFHHPMGIPIPHTNLIENRKKSIGDNLGGFVVSNFLNPRTIRPYIEKLHVSQYVAKWLGSEKNTERLLQEITWLLKDVIQKIDDDAAIALLSRKARSLLSDLKLNEALAEGIEMIMQRGDHERILNYMLKKVRHYIKTNEELVRQRVKKESHFLIPGFVDNMIAAKFTDGVARYLSEIEADPSHQLRQDLKQQLEQFINKIKTDEKWHYELQDVKDSLLSSERLNNYAAGAWQSLRGGIIADLTNDSSGIKSYLKKTITELAGNLQNDEQLRNKIDNWIRFAAYKFILNNSNKVGELISNTVGNWEGKELSDKLELEVGKDLQFIRINGTIVGGLVGLLIYTITKIFEN